MTNQSQQSSPKKTSTAMLVVMLAGGCIAFSLLMVVGKALSYGGVLLGLLAAGGCGYLLVKGPPERRKLAAGGAGLGILFVIFGFMGAGENRQKARAEAAVAAAAEKKAADDKAALENAIAQLGALDANGTSNQLVTACSAVSKLGTIPAQHMGRCGDAFLIEGQAQLGAKHPAEAVALLEQAVKLSSKAEEARTALASARIAQAVDEVTRDLSRAEDALTKKDFEKAAKVAASAKTQVESALKAAPDSAELKALQPKVAELVERTEAGPALADAAEKLDEAKKAESFDDANSALQDAKETVDGYLAQHPDSASAKALKKGIAAQAYKLQQTAEKAAAGRRDRKEVAGLFHDLFAAAGVRNMQVTPVGATLRFTSAACRLPEPRKIITDMVGTDEMKAKLKEKGFRSVDCYSPDVDEAWPITKL